MGGDVTRSAPETPHSPEATDRVSMDSTTINKPFRLEAGNESLSRRKNKGLFLEKIIS